MTLRWPWKVKLTLDNINGLHTSYLYPVGQNFHPFCSTTSRFQDSTYVHMRDLESLWGDLERSNWLETTIMVYILHTYTLWVQNLIRFALRPVVSEIAHMFTCMTLRWPWKVKLTWDSNNGLHTSYLYPVGPNFHPFCSTTSRFRDSANVHMRDLEVTLKGQIDFRLQ